MCYTLYKIHRPVWYGNSDKINSIGFRRVDFVQQSANHRFCIFRIPVTKKALYSLCSVRTSANYMTPQDFLRFPHNKNHRGLQFYGYETLRLTLLDTPFSS
jgi:hypothetical protein